MAVSNEKIKSAVLGCGRMGRRHAELIYKNSESQLIGLIDVQAKDVLKIEAYDLPFYFIVE